MEQEQFKMVIEPTLKAYATYDMWHIQNCLLLHLIFALKTEKNYLKIISKNIFNKIVKGETQKLVLGHEFLGCIYFTFGDIARNVPHF